LIASFPSIDTFSMGYTTARKNYKGDSQRLLTPKKSLPKSDEYNVQQRRFGRFVVGTTPPLTPDSPMNGVTVITTKGSPPNSPPRNDGTDTTVSDLSMSMAHKTALKVSIAPLLDTSVAATVIPEQQDPVVDYKEATDAIYKSLLGDVLGMMDQACQQVVSPPEPPKVPLPDWGVAPDVSDDDDDDSLFQSLETKPTTHVRDKTLTLHENFELVLDPDATMQLQQQVEKKRWWATKRSMVQSEVDRPSDKKSLGELDEVSFEFLNGEDLLGEELVSEQELTPKRVNAKTFAPTEAAVVPVNVDEPPETICGDAVVPKPNEEANPSTFMTLSSLSNPFASLSQMSYKDNRTLVASPEEVDSTMPVVATTFVTTNTIPPAVTTTPVNATTNAAVPPTEVAKPDEEVSTSTFMSLPSLGNPFASLSRMSYKDNGALAAASPEEVNAAMPVEVSTTSVTTKTIPPGAIITPVNTAMPPTVAARPALAPTLKPVWKEATDPTTGRTYYYHRLTRKATWSKPPCLMDGEPTSLEIISKKDFKVVIRQKKNIPREIQPSCLQQQFDEMVHKADLSAEKQRQMEGGEIQPDKKESILKMAQKDYPQSVWTKKVEIKHLLTKMAPPDGDSVAKVMQQYNGREDELLHQLRDMVNSKPFDEPIQTAESLCSSELPTDKDKEEAIKNVMPIVRRPKLLGVSMAPPSPLQLARLRTSQSNVTEKTEKTAKAGNLLGTHVFESIAEEYKVAETSLSGDEESYFPDKKISRFSPRVSPFTTRTRELRVEEFSSFRLGLKKERFNENSSYSPPRSAKHSSFSKSHDGNQKSSSGSSESNHAEVLKEAETETHASDSISALSQSDVEFLNRKEKFDKAQRKALDIAIRKKDWQTASEVTDDFRVMSKKLQRQVQSCDKPFGDEWSQSAVDKFISENDWDAVAKYIAYMRDRNIKESRISTRTPSAREEEFPRHTYPVRQTESIVTNTSSASSTTSSYLRKFGARSQLQHSTLQSVSSWESGSEYSDYSSASYDDLMDDEPKKRNFAC